MSAYYLQFAAIVQLNAELLHRLRTLLKYIDAVELTNKLVVLIFQKTAVTPNNVTNNIKFDFVAIENIIFDSRTVLFSAIKITRICQGHSISVLNNGEMGVTGPINKWNYI